MMEDSDDAVIERVRAGETEAFQVLVGRQSHALFRLACRMTGNKQDAEDVVQETFRRAFRRLKPTALMSFLLTGYLALCARPVPAWPDDRLTREADLMVMAKPVSVRDTGQTDPARAVKDLGEHP